MRKPIDVVRAFYTAVAQGDVPSVIAVLHPQLEGRRPKAFLISVVRGRSRMTWSRNS